MTLNISLEQKRRGKKGQEKGNFAHNYAAARESGRINDLFILTIKIKSEAL